MPNSMLEFLEHVSLLGDKIGMGEGLADSLRILKVRYRCRPSLDNVL